MANAYQYDASGYFAGEVEDYGLLPNNATNAAPEIQAGYIPHWTGTAWEQVEDHKGLEGYLNGKPYTIKDYGPLPEGWSDTPPPPTLEEARAAKIAAIDAETSAAILAGFDYAIDGRTLHFSYDTHDQQNFADTANAATLAMMGVPGVPGSVTWNGWEIKKDAAGKETARSLVRLSLTPETFLALYMGGALTHKGTQMEIGGTRKAAAEAAATVEELEAI
jgi:hypothetical protein